MNEVYQTHLPEFLCSIPVEDVNTKDGVEEICEQIADIVTRDINTLPLDIDSLITHYGLIQGEHDGNLKNYGRLIPLVDKRLPGYYRVEIDRSVIEEEQRFTTGHEFGHAVLISLAKKVGRFSLPPGEEELCHYFSRAVLAPRRLVIAEYQKVNSEDPLQDVSNLAKLFQIPVEQMLQRLVGDLDLLEGDFISWAWENGLRSGILHIDYDSGVISQSSAITLFMRYMEYQRSVGKDSNFTTDEVGILVEDTFSEEADLYNAKIRLVNLNGREIIGQLLNPTFVASGRRDDLTLPDYLITCLLNFSQCPI